MGPKLFDAQSALGRHVLEGSMTFVDDVLDAMLASPDALISLVDRGLGDWALEP